MPEFSADGPVDLAIDVPSGRIHVTAGDRADVIVRVDPSNPARQADVRAAAETVVDQRDGRITIAAPHRFVPFGASESIDVTVEAPAGSRLSADLSVGRFRAEGRLGATRVKTAAADVRVEHAEHLETRVSSGEIVVGRVDGDAELTSGNGRIEVGHVGGTSSLKTSNGDARVGTAAGPVTAKLANGAISVDRALDSVTARTSLGRITIGEVSTGRIQLDTGLGEVAVGIRPGVAAWLDVQSKSGVVSTQIDEAPAPGAGESTVEVRVRTSLGDITVRPAPAP